MFRNYFKTALRSLSRNKFFATLNVFSLALGMSITLVFVATLSFIYRYDDFHTNKDRIFRVTTSIHDNETNPTYASAPAGLAQLLKDNVTGVESVVRIDHTLRGDAVNGEKKIPVTGYFADPEFLSVFDFPLIQGSVATALTRPNTVTITEETAYKMFGDKDPVGEVINVEPYGDLLITGLLKDIPKNSHMKFDAIVSYSTLKEEEKDWKHFINSYVYILTSDSRGIDRYLSTVSRDKQTSYHLQSLNAVVPGPQLNNPIGPSWDYVGVTLFGLLTIIILVPACANYINLAISQSLRRMKEIGVRKVMGGQKKQIFLQFIIETCITMLFALVLSYFFFEIIRGEALSMIAGADILDLKPTLLTFTGFISFALGVGFFAGIVPALYFSRVAPVNALKGKEVKTGSRSGLTMRKVVITAQFILSLGFIMAVVIMLQQYRYSVNYDFGFDRQNILDIELQSADPQLLKNEFGKLSQVHSISMSSHIPGLGFDNGYVKATDRLDSMETSSMSIDENFIPTMRLQMIHGRNFDQNAGGIIVNEELATKLNSEDPFNSVEQKLILPDGREVRIIGIVKNFHYSSLRDPIASFYFEYNPERFNYANVKVQSANRSEMTVAWKTIGGEDKFKAELLSDQINNYYEFYFVIIKLWSFLGLLAITVACLGMLGSVVFTIKNRLKEISLRKVMGASAESLVFLLSKDFLVMMLVASVITIPVVYFLFENMLVSIQHYSVQIGAMEIVISLSIMLLLGITTIMSQTLKAANTNPVDNLRVE